VAPVRAGLRDEPVGTLKKRYFTVTSILSLIAWRTPANTCHARRESLSSRNGAELAKTRYCCLDPRHADAAADEAWMPSSSPKSSMPLSMKLSALVLPPAKSRPPGR
jgi:hypothetical protein